MQKGGSMCMRQNEFLFKPTATNTHFWVICSKMKCVLVLNASHFGAKRKVKCRLMLGEKHKNTLQWYKQNLYEP